MYQIVLRPNPMNKRVTDKYFDVFAKSYEDLICNGKKVVASVQKRYGEGEAYNLYYNASYAVPGNRKQFLKQEIIPFDIDKIDYSRKEEYLIVIQEVLDIPLEQLTIIWSGNGVQVLVRTSFFDVAFIESMKPAYHNICKALTEGLQMDELPFEKVDTTVWCKTQLLRLPHTQNRKPVSKPFGPQSVCKEAVLHHASTDIVQFDWKRWEETKQDEPKPKPTKASLATPALPLDYPAHEPDYVMEHCSFLKERASTGGKDDSYEVWFAALGITSHFDTLDASTHFSHVISKAHPTYDPMEVEQKVTQCQQAGPRTCKAISVFNAGCANCPFKDSGIGTPLNLRKRKRPIDPIEEFEAQHGIMDWQSFEPKDTKDEQLLPRPTKGTDHVSKSLPVPEDSGDVGAGCGDDTRHTGDEKESSESDETKVPSCQGSKSDVPTEEVIDWASYIQEGFTKQDYTKTGTPKKPVRLVNALRRYFSDQCHFFNVPFLRRHYIWKDNYYQQITEDEIKAFAQGMYRPLVTEEKDRVEFYKNMKVHNIQHHDVLNMEGREGLVNCANGIYDIFNDKFLPHSPKFKFFHVLPYNYDPLAKCPTWDLLLKNITCDRPHLQEAIEEFLGWAIVGGNYSPQKILILFGGGDNGKTTLANIMEMVVGECNASHVAAKEISNPHEAVRLENKLLNISEEEPVDSFRDSGPLKRMTGDGFIKVAYLYQNKYDYKNRAKQVITYNTLPKLTDASEGMKRRLMIIPFDMSMSREPEKRIPEIYEKIRDELSGIMNRAILAYRRLTERGNFAEIEESNIRYDQMIVESNPVLDWCTGNLEVTGKELDRISGAEMYDQYCDDNPYQRMSKIQFNREVKDHLQDFGITYDRYYDESGNRKRGYVGVRNIDDIGTSQDKTM